MADVKNNLGNIAAMAERPQAPTNRPAQYNDRHHSLHRNDLTDG